MCYRKVVLLWLAVFIVHTYGRPQDMMYLTEDCLTCMCEASTECNDDLQCVGGRSRKWCGPYLISDEYWEDGGRLGEDFRSCAMYRPCAEATIRGHMKNLGIDCNNDNKIDCLDYARIHKVGPGGCNGTQVMSTDYWLRFEACYYNLL